MTAISALILGESPRSQSLAAILEGRGHELELTHAASFDELRQTLSSGSWDLILLEEALEADRRAALLAAAGPVISGPTEPSEVLVERLLAALEVRGSDPSFDIPRIRRVTHDLSNAVALISGFADLLGENDAGFPAGGPGERYLSIIKRRSGEAVAFLNELRALLLGKDADEDGEDAPVESEPEPEAGPSGPLSLLLIDDEPRLLEVLSVHLERAGHKVETAGDAQEGLRRFISGRFDLVLTDQEMPGQSGEELAKVIKERAPGTPVILLTGHGARADSSADRTLGKPVRPTDLLDAIHDLKAEGRSP